MELDRTMTPLLCGVLMLAAAQDGPPLVLERTFGDDRWLASPERFERVALSPDGRRLAASSRDTRVQVWDVDARRLLHETTFGQNAKAVDLLLPDADTLLVSHADGFLRAYPLAAPDRPSAEHRIGARTRLWPAPSPGEVYAGAARLDWKSGEVKLRLQAPTEVLALAATEARVYTGHGVEVVEWDARTGAQRQRRRFDASFGQVQALALDPSGARLASGHECGRLLEWAPDPRVLLAPAFGGYAVIACGWLPEGGPAVAVHTTAAVRRADGGDKRGGGPPFLGAAAAAFARGGAVLAMAEGTARRRGIAEVPVGWNHPGPWSVALWDAKADRFWRPQGGAHDHPVQEAAVRGTRLVTQSYDAVVLSNLGTGEVLVRILDEPRGFAVDDKRLLTSSAAGLQLWDLDTGKRLAAIAEAVGWSVGLQGRRAVLSRGEAVDVWDLETGRMEGTVAAGGSVDAVHASAEPGRVVLSLSKGFAVMDVERREIVGRVQGGFLEKALSADGRRAALMMGIADGYEYQVVETATARVLGRLARRDPATALAFHGPALWIRFAGNQVVRWDGADQVDEHALTRKAGSFLPLDARRALVSSGPELFEVDLAADRWSPAATGHRGGVAGLILLDGGKAVLSYGADRTARLWARKGP
jgi:WD40 repeat protein